ncbi:hypothetical protein NHH03_17450 [Stieleria sp. TO1_6]|uniref:hypothetical protein n=1 Tax=Stieleria tagensis TaxID=2956795 RepID=UPI00209B2300|nr:hypothetical protein [Stieleria tagensis]MCO8123537.1 hypothetical protein [Stieleria tagensis]
MYLQMLYQLRGILQAIEFQVNTPTGLPLGYMLNVEREMATVLALRKNAQEGLRLRGRFGYKRMVQTNCERFGSRPFLALADATSG